MGKCLSCCTIHSTDQGTLAVHSSSEDKEIEINGKSKEFEIAGQKKEIEIDDEEKVTEKSKKESMVSEIMQIIKSSSDDIIFVKAKDYITEVDAVTAFANKHLILFYFSANSCPPCREFTPKLVDFYNNFKGHGVEIIFVSLDENLNKMVSSMEKSHGDWISYTYDSLVVNQVKEIKQKYGSEFDLPLLIVVNIRDYSKVISYDGVNQIMKTSKGPEQQIELIRDWKVTGKSNKERMASEIMQIITDSSSTNVMFVKAKDYDTKVDVQTAFANKNLILFYFSANSCPPCREFTPKLVDFYNNVKDHGVEIIFVSLDQNVREMISSMKESHGDWIAYTYDSPIVKQVKKIKQKYGSEFDLPHLTIINLEDPRKVLTYDGIDQIMKTNKGSDQIELIRDWKV